MTEQERDKLLYDAEVMCHKRIVDCKTEKKKLMYAHLINTIHRDRCYKITNIDNETNTGLCACGRVTDIIDEPFYCKYCGQKLSATFGWSIHNYYND